MDDNLDDYVVWYKRRTTGYHDGHWSAFVEGLSPSNALENFRKGFASSCEPFAIGKIENSDLGRHDTAKMWDVGTELVTTINYFVGGYRSSVREEMVDDGS